MTVALITNDDGIDSPGLHALALAAVSHGLDVFVAAPIRQSSGSSASIIAAEEDGRIQIERREIGGLEGVAAYAVRGAPGLIALLAAHGAFTLVPDLVLSGINHGANVGRAVEDLPNTPEPGSDAAILAEGFATLTSISPVSQVPLGTPITADY